MSLSIDDRFITGLFAFDQWFKVKKGSVCVDSYEFLYWEENPDPGEGVYDCYHISYQMGAHYAAKHEVRTFDTKTKGRWINPSGATGITFIDADTDERVSFALLEVKAFREDRS